MSQDLMAFFLGVVLSGVGLAFFRLGWYFLGEWMR